MLEYHEYYGKKTSHSLFVFSVKIFVYLTNRTLMYNKTCVDVKQCQFEIFISVAIESNKVRRIKVLPNDSYNTQEGCGGQNGHTGWLVYNMHYQHMRSIYRTIRTRF